MLRKICRCIWVLPVLVLCAAVNGTIALAQTSTQKVATESATAAAADKQGSASVGAGQSDNSQLKIGPGDLLTLTVFDVPELSQEVRVGHDGDAEIELLGTIHLAGMTIPQAQTFIETQLRNRNFVNDPHVELLEKEYATQGVSVLGQVAHPGVYPVLGPRSLTDLISEAGGLTPLASTEATIKHRIGTQDTVTVGIPNESDQLLSNDVEVQPGDTVYIPKAGIVYVLGDVGRPGGFLMQNSGKITLLEAVALAAGANPTASADKTRIIRKTGTGLKEADVDLKRILKGKQPDLVLQAEDIVYIPPSGVKTLLYHPPAITQSAASAAIYQGIMAVP